MLLLASLLVVVVAQAPGATTPVPGKTLALDDVLLAVDAEHPLLDAARADSEAAGAEVFAAHGGFDPTLKARGGFIPISGYQSTRFDLAVEQPTPLWGLNLFAGYRLGQGDFPAYYGERATNSLGEIRAGLELPLLRNGWADRRRTTLTRASQGHVAAQAAVASQRLELARQAASRYWDWVGAGRRREIARALLGIAQSRDGQLTGRVSAGDLSRFELQDNQRAVVQRQALLISAQRAVEQAAIELSLFLRDEAGKPVLPDDAWLPARFPEPETNAQRFKAVALDEALARRPDVARLQAQRAQALADADLARNQVLPSLDVGAVVRKDFGTGDAKRDAPDLEFSVVLDLPIPNRANRGRRDAASLQLRRLEAQLSFARDRVGAEVRDALSALDASRQRIDAARTELVVARELEKKERERFELGDSTLLFVNLREQQSAEAAAREIDALVDYHRAVAAWRAAVADVAPATRPE